MQACECGKVLVDFGAGGNSGYNRVLWPSGNMEDWVEIIDNLSEGRPKPAKGEAVSRQKE